LKGGGMQSFTRSIGLGSLGRKTISSFLGSALIIVTRSNGAAYYNAGIVICNDQNVAVLTVQYF
jgi:hypothetical protein